MISMEQIPKAGLGNPAQSQAGGVKAGVMHPVLEFLSVWVEEFLSSSAHPFVRW